MKRFLQGRNTTDFIARHMMAECLTEKRMFHCCEFRTVVSSPEAVGVTSLGSAGDYFTFRVLFFLAVALQNDSNDVSFGGIFKATCTSRMQTVKYLMSAVF